MILDFKRMSLTDAQACAALIEQRWPVKLRELAGWLAADGEPLERYDCSLGSLLPLWEWYLRSLEQGLPGVPAGAAGTWFDDASRRSSTHDGPDSGRASYAVEALAAYAVLVLRRVFPDSTWTTYEQPRRGAPHTDHLEPQLMFAHCHFSPSQAFNFLMHGALARAPRQVNPAAMREQLSYTIGLVGEDRLRTAEEPGEPVLARLLAEQPDPPLPPGQHLPTFLDLHGPLQLTDDWAKRTTSRGRGRTTSLERYLYAGPLSALDDDDLTRHRPLDATIAAEHLHAMGFTTDAGQRAAGEPPPLHQLVDLAAADTQLVHTTHAALVDTHTHDGTLRALHVEAHDLTTTDARRLRTQLTALARTLGARTATPDS